MLLILTTRHALLRSASLLMLTFAGCSMVNPEIAQLDRYQQARAARQWQAIADDVPANACQPVVEGCARLYAIYGEANQHLAFSSLAPKAFCPPPATNGLLNKASVSFSKSEQFADASLTPEAKTELKVMHTQALYCLAENAPSIEEGTALIRQSAGQAAGLPRADALYWQAISQLYLARPGAGTDAQRCTAAHMSSEAAVAARTAGISPVQNQTLNRVSHDADLVRRSLAGCKE